jgi:hypothetical protein
MKTAVLAFILLPLWSYAGYLYLNNSKQKESISKENFLTSVTNVPVPQDTKVTRTIKIGDLLKAIAIVESNQDDEAVGDKGKSIGRYQIQKAYWKDATDHDKSLKQGNGKWEDCKYESYATSVVLSYFDRYAAQAVKNEDWELLARLHNGGPSVLKKEPPSKIWNNTTVYWNKVKKELEK